MKKDEVYDYNSAFPNPNEDIPIDILNYIPIWYINNTYNNYWNIIEVTELMIILPY